jgi:hypothetical protein
LYGEVLITISQGQEFLDVIAKLWSATISFVME